MNKLIYLSFAQGTYVNGVLTGKIDGPLLAKSVSSVMIRAGQGVWEDPLFRYHYKICVDNKIPFGIWWFNQPNMEASPQVNASMTVWNSLPLKPLVIAYDVEEIDYKDLADGVWKKLFPPSRRFSHDNVLKWCRDVKSYTKGNVGIYTRKFYFEQWTYETDEWYDYWMWIAAWYNWTGQVPPALPWKWPTFKIHQFEAGGLGTPGVDPAHTCKEYFNGDNPKEFFETGGVSLPPTEFNPYFVDVTSWYLTGTTGPGPNYPPIVWLKKGDRVEILEVANGWGRFKDGWINLDFTVVADTTPPPTMPTIQEQLDALARRVTRLEAFHDGPG